MALTSPQLTGLILGILLPILLIAGISLLIYRYQRRSNTSLSSPKSNPEALDSPARFTLAPDDQADSLRQATVRRQTGQPQTFTDWVERSNGEARVLGSGERWPSLEYGPGPVVVEPALVSSPYHSSTNTTNAAVVADEEVKDEGAKEDLGVKKACRKRSIDESSLREAVLGVDVKKDEVERKESSMKIKKEQVVEKETGEVRKTRGYSGAWP